jgi:hypothetical protein
LARAFAEANSGEAPELPYFLVGAATIFHRPTVEKIHAMSFDSGLIKAVPSPPRRNERETLNNLADRRAGGSPNRGDFRIFDKGW